MSSTVAGTTELILGLVSGKIIQGTGLGRYVNTVGTRDLLSSAFREAYKGSASKLAARYIVESAAQGGISVLEEGVPALFAAVIQEKVDSELTGTPFDFNESVRRNIETFVAEGSVGLIYNGNGA